MAATIEEVRRVLANFRRRLRRWSWKIQSCRDRDKSFDYAIRHLQILTERNLKLREMGWWEDIDGNLEVITPELIARERARQKAKETKLDRLKRKARRTMSQDDMRAFIKELARVEE